MILTFLHNTNNTQGRPLCHVVYEALDFTQISGGVVVLNARQNITRFVINPLTGIAAGTLGDRKPIPFFGFRQGGVTAPAFL